MQRYNSKFVERSSFIFILYTNIVNSQVKKKYVRKNDMLNLKNNFIINPF